MNDIIFLIIILLYSVNVLIIKSALKEYKNELEYDENWWKENKK